MKALPFLPPCNHVFEKAVTTWVYCSPSHPFCYNELINASLRNKCCDVRLRLISWTGWRRYLSVFQTEMSLLLPGLITSQLMSGCAKSKIKVVNNTKFTLKHKHRQIPLSENILKPFPGKPRKTLWHTLLFTEDNQLLLLTIKTGARKGLRWWEMEHI